MQTILAIDDEKSVRESYRMIFADRFHMIIAEDAATGLRLLEEKHVDLILLDLTMPGISGLQFLGKLDEIGDTTPVVVVTGSSSVESAVTAMKHGARDFVVKPFDVEDLQMLTDRILDEVRSRRELNALREREITGFDNIIGDSPALMATLAKAQQAMQVDSTVLITGETGTGKDVLARAIHYGSRRAARPFVPLCCSAIPANLVESELFGHARGAFTGATESRVGKMQVADGGTLFLDEIGEMPLEIQSKFLRVLQDGSFYPVGDSREVSVDLRVICATNRNFAQAIEDGQFREDLYYRVNVLPIEAPPLRKRREDIPALVAHFVEKHSPRVNAQVREFSPRAMTVLKAYHWPGNIRELENTVERILVCNSRETVIDNSHLQGLLPQPKIRMESHLDEFQGLPLQDATERLERHLIERALRRTNFVQSRAADELGTTRRILKYKMDLLGIDHPEDTTTIAS